MGDSVGAAVVFAFGWFGGAALALALIGAFVFVRGGRPRQNVRAVSKRPSLEGFEVAYSRDGLLRAARIGAMNCEHKELLLVVNDESWRDLSPARKQNVLGAARTTWAEKMCPNGPDVAYVILKTESGAVVGRAAPASMSVA